MKPRHHGGGPLYPFAAHVTAPTHHTKLFATAPVLSGAGRMQMHVLVKIFGRIFVGKIFVATAGISVVKSRPETKQVNISYRSPEDTEH